MAVSEAAKEAPPDGQLVKPVIDGFDYRFIDLDNGMRCLLVSDPEADKGAAAMDVSCGVGVVTIPPRVLRVQ